MSQRAAESPVRITPDFSRQALAQLLDEARQLGQLARAATAQNDDNAWPQLQTVSKRIHAILIMLSRPGAALIIEEINAVAHCLSQPENDLTESAAHTLLNATEIFIDYLSYLQWPGATDSVLSALPVLNDCRALRDADLLSENLLLAAGIQLPDVSAMAVPSAEELQQFSAQLQVSRQPLIQALLDWYRASDNSAAMQELASLFTGLAEVKHSPSQLQPLRVLFESAAVVSDALATGELHSTALLKHQFAQLERLLKRWIKLSPTDFPLQAVQTPETVFRNFLYTIATENLSSARAAALRRKFDLELFNFKKDTALRQAFVPTRVSAALGQSVRDSVSHEIEALQRWLSQAASDPTHSKAVDLRTRLSQLEPALALLDEQQALAHLVAINSGLAAMVRDVANGASESKARERRLEIAQATIKFRRSLDQQHRLPATELSQASALQEDASDSFSTTMDNASLGSSSGLEEHPQHRLLWQAQQQLQSIERRLEDLFVSGANAQLDTRQQATLLQAREGLQEIEQVLQILPLPEVSPLLRGMRAFLDYCAVSSPGLQSKRQFAELLVCIDYYLASVLSPHDSASQLLMNAEIILQQLEHAISAEADDAPAEHDETQLIAISGDALASLIDVSLEQMAVVGDQLLVLNQSPAEPAPTEALKVLHSAWKKLQASALEHAASDLNKLAEANVHVTSALVSQQVSIGEAISLLEESHAVLPQLMDQHQGHSDQIIGFNTLLETMNALPSSVGSSNAPEQQNRDVQIHQSTPNDLVQNDLDNTLQEVFYQECQGHIDTLRDALKVAAQRPNDHAVALPTPAVLRALHTLTGAAQTVSEGSIIALAQPLQKITLLRQRNNQVFSADETRFVEQVIDALQTRVDALEKGVDASTLAVEVEQAVVALADQVVSEPPAYALPEQSLEQRLSASLKSVFVDEAVDLLEQMRASIDRHHAGTIELGSLLNELKSPVHTLKGSARMAGFTEFASRVHALEPALDAGELADVAKIEQELGSLQAMLLPDSPKQSTAIQEQAKLSPVSSDENITVSEAGFAKMMSLATQASVSQAKLGEQLLRMNDIYRDLDSSTQRLRKQIRNTSRQATAAEQEMLADLDAARSALANTLHLAESEHLQGSRADAELQQSLIRAQLVKFGACQTRLERAAQDSALQLGVSLSMQFSGTAINLDRALYRQLLAPLEHLVRNAVAHGIEPSSERLAANKSEQGKIVIEADFDGNDLVITVKDDGAGIDIERLNNARVAAGKAQLETGQALRDALCEPGFSTRDKADEIAGRGMGLAVVDQLAMSLGGNLQIASMPGAGTTISLRLPQKVIVNQVVLVRCGQAHYAIPVKHVHTVLAELENADAIQEFNGRQYMPYKLSELLGLPISTKTTPSLFLRDKGKAHACILAQAGGQHIALDVDAVVGYREIIAQAIGPQLLGLKRFRGGSVLADGTAVLILDMPRLMTSVPLQALNASANQIRSRAPIALVVDDSITMRVAAEHFLEEQGIRSRMARDGIEALSMLQQQLPDVLLLDIDMPRLNGFELLQHLRQSYPDHRLPVIMVSTRSGEVERERAAALGATHFIGKPYHAADLHRALSELNIISGQSDKLTDASGS